MINTVKTKQKKSKVSKEERNQRAAVEYIRAVIKEEFPKVLEDLKLKIKDGQQSCNLDILACTTEIPYTLLVSLGGVGVLPLQKIGEALRVNLLDFVRLIDPNIPFFPSKRR